MRFPTLAVYSLVCFLSASLFSSPVQAQSFRYRFTDLPKPTGAKEWGATSINNSGNILGGYIDSQNVHQGFLLTGITFQSLNFPISRGTYPTGMNNNGDLVGAYLATDDTLRAFVRRASTGEFQELSFPQPRIESAANDISDDGLIIGYRLVDNVETAFVFDANSARTDWNMFENPEVPTLLLGINGKHIVGEYQDQGSNPRGLFATFNPSVEEEPAFIDEAVPVMAPLARETSVTSVNSHGEYVGSYQITSSGGGFRRAGFWMKVDEFDGLQPDRSEFMTVAVPGAIDTLIQDINDSGVIVGEYYKPGDPKAYAFIGNPVPNIPGDINLDGRVDLVDFNFLKANFGRTGAGIPGDVNGDFVLDAADLPNSGSLRAVPEPSSAFLALLALGGLVIYRRCR